MPKTPPFKIDWTARAIEGVRWKMHESTSLVVDGNPRFVIARWTHEDGWSLWDHDPPDSYRSVVIGVRDLSEGKRLAKQRALVPYDEAAIDNDYIEQLEVLVESALLNLKNAEENGVRAMARCHRLAEECSRLQQELDRLRAKEPPRDRKPPFEHP
jgi:hypothetical protein